jgi:hypothetical protein
MDVPRRCWSERRPGSSVSARAKTENVILQCGSTALPVHFSAAGRQITASGTPRLPCVHYDLESGKSRLAAKPRPTVAFYGDPTPPGPNARVGGTEVPGWVIPPRQANYRATEGLHLKAFNRVLLRVDAVEKGLEQRVEP